MTITATELRANPGKYLALAVEEDVYITQHGKVVAKLSNPFRNRLEVAESLFGSVPAGMTLEEARKDNTRNG
ncbi:MAG: type II toxin-antitoxin system Phd/YefM family antitoxin [Clostridia bacterium]|nr:type II toxin-antitoxin system Phd/YefM family antitoxin [Clostridia bacterium]